MYQYIIIFLTILFLNGCGGENTVRVISDIEDGVVAVDGKEISRIRVGYARLLLSSGQHSVLVTKLTNDGEWLYKGEKNFTINDDAATNVDVETQKIETQKRKDRLQRDKIWLEKYAKKGITFTDIQAHLIWQDGVETKSIKRNWNAAQTYCRNLKTLNLKWYLPSAEELFNLTTKHNQLTNVTSNAYWSSKTNSEGLAREIIFSYNWRGRGWWTGKGAENYVRCVSKGE